MSGVLVVRSVEVDDEDAIRQLFETTVMLGRPSPGPIVLFDAYSDLCLGWYLTHGRSLAAVAELDGTVVGYALACDDPAGQARWSTFRIALLAARVVARLVTGRLDSSSRTFYWARARDARGLRRGSVRPPCPLQVHLNVCADHRTGTVALGLRDHLDRVCVARGHRCWYGEINSVAGRRARAFDRLGLRVIDRTPNRTMTTVLGVCVDRLTVVRTLPPPSPAAP